MNLYTAIVKGSTLFTCKDILCYVSISIEVSTQQNSLVKQNYDCIPTTDLLDNHVAEGEETGGSEGDEEPQHGHVPRTPARHGRDSREIRGVLQLPD